MRRIFISYRRADSAPYAGRIYDHLANHFGRDEVFMDIDTIRPGVDFVETLDNALEECEALIVVIGKQWLTVTDSSGKRRLDDENDFTRLEVQTALERNTRVIPVLVDGAAMPRTDELPGALSKLTRRNALTVSNERFGYDVGRLISSLDEILQVAPPGQPAPSTVPTHTSQSLPVESIREVGKASQSQTFIQRRGIGIALLMIVSVTASGYVLWLLNLTSFSQEGVIHIAITVAESMLPIIGIIGTLRWKRWGVYCQFAYIIVAAFIGFVAMQSSPTLDIWVPANIIFLVGTSVFLLIALITLIITLTATMKDKWAQYH